MFETKCSSKRTSSYCLWQDWARTFPSGWELHADCPHGRSVATGCQLGNLFPSPPMKTSQANSADFLELSGKYVPAEGKYTKKMNPIFLFSPRKLLASSKGFFLPLIS